MSAQLVPEMDTTEALPWVRDMQSLTQGIIELMALTCYTCVAPDGAMVEASHWSDVLGNPPASSLDSFLDKMKQIWGTPLTSPQRHTSSTR